MAVLKYRLKTQSVAVATLAMTLLPTFMTATFFGLVCTTTGITLVTSCKGNDEPAPKPEPESKIEELNYVITSIADMEKDANKISQEAYNNDPAKRKITIDLTGNFGLTNDNKRHMFEIPVWVAAANKGVTLNKGSAFAYSDGKTYLNASDTTWVKIIPIGKNPSNGTMFYVNLNDMIALNKIGWDHLVQLDGTEGEYSDAMVIRCNHESEFTERINDVKIALALPGDKKVVLVMNGVYNMDNVKSKAIDELFDDPKMDRIDGTNAMVLATTDSVVVRTPGKWAESFKFDRNAFNTSKYYYVPGTVDMNDKLAFGNELGVIRTDTLHVSGANIERGTIMPDTAVIDADLLSRPRWTPNMFRNFKNRIIIRSLPNPTAPGRFNRLLNVDNSIFSTEKSRASGDKSGPFYYEDNPVLFGYYKQFERGPNANYALSQIDVATDKEIVPDMTHAARSVDYGSKGVGNYGVQKLQGSNEAANKGSETELFPILGSFGAGVAPTYTPTFLFNEEYSLPAPLWKSDPLVSLETFRNVCQAFGLRDSDKNGYHVGNIYLFVRIDRITLVLDDVTYNWYRSQTDPTSALMGKIIKDGWLTISDSGFSVVSRATVDEHNKKVY